MRRNITIDADWYKIPHFLEVQEDFTDIDIYAENRINSRYPFLSFIGLDMIIQDNFLSVPTNADIEEGREESFLAFGQDYFNVEVWKKVQKLGYLPIEIKAIPEGTNIPINNAIYTLRPTEPWFAKTTNSLESLLHHFWYPSTVATRAKVIKERLRPLVEKSGTIERLESMVIDFGFRGASWYESAVVGGMGVMMHFSASDNAPASRLLKDYYGFQGRAKSVWGTEHSIALAFGDDEEAYVIHQLDHCPLDALCALVIDTKDSRNFMYNIIGLPHIIKRIKARAKAGGGTIFRPDSGKAKLEVQMVFDACTQHFGYTLNNKGKGYKVFKHNVSALQGDGMKEMSIDELYTEIINNDWSSDNLSVGSGGGLLQSDIDRDTQRSALKPSVATINGVERNLQKTPKTDMTKMSKTGHLKTIAGMNGNMRTISSATETVAQFAGYVDLKNTVYLKGEPKNKNNFKDMIERSNMPFDQYFYK